MLQLDKGLPDGWIVGVDVLCAAHAEAKIGAALYRRQGDGWPTGTMQEHLPLRGAAWVGSGGCGECRRKGVGHER